MSTTQARMAACLTAWCDTLDDLAIGAESVGPWRERDDELEVRDDPSAPRGSCQWTPVTAFPEMREYILRLEPRMARRLVAVVRAAGAVAANLTDDAGNPCSALLDASLEGSSAAALRDALVALLDGGD